MALTVGGYLWPERERAVAVAAVVAITLVNLGGLTRTVAVTRILLVGVAHRARCRRGGRLVEPRGRPRASHPDRRRTIRHRAFRRALVLRRSPDTPGSPPSAKRYTIRDHHPEGDPPPRCSSYSPSTPSSGSPRWPPSTRHCSPAPTHPCDSSPTPAASRWAASCGSAPASPRSARC